MRQCSYITRIFVSTVICALGFIIFGATTTRADEAVSFERDIVPLLKSRCAACHLTGQEPGHMALHPKAAYQSLVDVQSFESPLLRVKPGAPDESYIIRKLEGTHLAAGGIGLRMPLEGGPLSEVEIQRIREWITAGAPKN
jgi:hypothetical protein